MNAPNALRLALPALLTLTTACASLTAPSARVTDARLGLVPVLAARTAFETEEASRSADRQRDDEPRRRRDPSTAAFWAGVIIGAVGTAGAIALGSAARITERQIIHGYEGDGLSHERLDTLGDRGKALNKATVASLGVGLAGALMAAAAYGVEWTKCGDLAPKRRRCAER